MASYDWVDQAVKNAVSKKGTVTPVSTVAPTPTSAPVTTPAPKFGVREALGGAASEIGKTGPVRVAAAGLGKVGELLGRPSQWVENTLTNNTSYEQAGWGKASTPARFILDPLNLLPVVGWGAKAVGVTAKANQVVKGLNLANKATQTLGKVERVAMAQPKVANVVEKLSPYVSAARKTVDPFYKVPELGKMSKASEEARLIAQNKLLRDIRESSQGLSQAQRERIGQMIEGGVSGSKGEENMVKVAKQFAKEGEIIGKQMVDEKLLTPEQFAAYKGKYMHHMWTNATEGKSFLEGISDITPKIKGKTQMFRKGTEGYTRDYAPATFAGLGSSLGDIEAARFYKNVGKTFGKKADLLQAPEGVVKGSLNEVLADYKPPRPGLGPIDTAAPTANDLAMESLNTIKKYQPARPVVGQGIGADVRGVTGKVTGGEESFKGSFIGDQKSPTAYVTESLGTAPTESNLSAKFSQVGELPGPKVAKTKLKLGTQVRDIPEGYVYAPEVLTKATGGKILEGMALPKDVVDILVERASFTKPGQLMQLYDKAMSVWKKGKTLWNPAYHARNFVSNQILSELQTGQGLPRTLWNYARNTKNYFSKVKGEYVKEAEDIGLIRRQQFGETVKELSGEVTKKEGVVGKLQGVDEMTHKVQNAMEETAKLNVYEYFRKAGKGIPEAKNLAEEAIFSPYRISAAERSAMGRAIPFYSFFRQAAPFIGKKLVTHPERFAKYPKIERAVESLSQGEGEENLPDYMKEYVRTPFKNELGQQKYFNPQYFYPWGGFLNEQKPLLPGVPLGLSKNPIAEEIFAQSLNKDPFFGTEIVDKTMSGPEQAKARIGHAAMTALPNLYRTARGKVEPVVKKKVLNQGTGKDYAGRNINLKDVALGEGLGIKLYPFNVESGAKTKSWETYDLVDQFKSRIKKVARDQSMTEAERDAEIQRLQAQLEQMLQEQRE